MTAKELMNVLNPPPGPVSREFCIDVRLATGRLYLNVFGVTTAVEGDLCRDSKIGGRTWDGNSLESAAEVARERLKYMLLEMGVISPD